VQWRWSSLNLLNDTHAAGLPDTTINPPPNNNQNLRKQYYRQPWSLPSINHHAVIRTPLCIPQQPWKPSPKSVLNSKQNYLPRLGKRVRPGSITSDLTPAQDIAVPG
jgi:hypothetical protein